MFEGRGAAPLSGAVEQTTRAIRAYSQYACLLSLQMAHGEYKQDWTRRRNALSSLQPPFTKKVSRRAAGRR
jgi:hypothetical protein